MADPRCNCREPDCPICTAPAHTPWQPKPGTSSPPQYQMFESREEAEEHLAALRRWETWQSIRRYLLVLLLTGLGSMIGSAITLLTFIHYN